MPQLFMLSKTGEAETITAHYLFALGSYRALYILNWVYRYYVETFFDPIAVVAGIVQTVLYADFFYLYVTRGKCIAVDTDNLIIDLLFSVLRNRRVELPA
jgi:ER lumen protein retaining receptor